MIDRNLASQLYEAVKDANEERVYEHWHASSIARCPAEHYFLRKGEPVVNEPTSALMLRWQVGHHMETGIRPYLQQLYPNVMVNQRLTSQEWDLTGEYDLYDPDSETLIEVKSVHPYAIGHLEKEGKPHLHYILQNHAYKILLEETGYHVKQIVFVYLSLDGRVLTFTIQPDDEYEGNVKKRLTTLSEAWENDIPPVCICRKDGKFNTEHPLWKPQMQYCSYKVDGSCCLEEYKEEI